MYDELTEVDIEKLRAELATCRSRSSALNEEVKRTRDYGDRSENHEYHCARREYRKNASRIRYLERMIETARIIKPNAKKNVVGLFDAVTLRYEDGRELVVRFVTTLRNDVFQRCISKESPLGKAVLGKQCGDTVTVKTDTRTYTVTIVALEKGEDDASLPIHAR